MNPYKPNQVIKVLETSFPAAQVQVLSAALSAAQLDSVDEPERQAAEVLSEASGSGPSAGDRRPAPPASAPQRERPTASAAGSTVSVGLPRPQPPRMGQGSQSGLSLMSISWQR